jgi:hypothetical protein
MNASLCMIFNRQGHRTKWAKTITETTEDGKEHTDMIDNIVIIEQEPGEPAVERQDEIEDDAGDEPSTGRPLKKGHPAIEAKAAVPGTPDKAIIKTGRWRHAGSGPGRQGLRDLIG